MVPSFPLDTEVHSLCFGSALFDVPNGEEKSERNIPLLQEHIERK